MDVLRLLLEVTMGKVSDWETNDEWGDKFNVTIKPDELYEKAINKGGSISTDQYVYAPDFLLTRDAQVNLQKYITMLARENGSVNLTLRPGFTDGSMAIPYAVYDKLSGVWKRDADQQRDWNGGIVVEVDGMPVTDASMQDVVGVVLGKETEPTRIDPKSFPKWLERLLDHLKSVDVDAKADVYTKSGVFYGDLVIDSGGDAVLILSRSMGRGAYVLKRDMGGVDWDVAVAKKYREIKSEKTKEIRKRQRAEPEAELDVSDIRPAKLDFRDWLYENDFGFMLRRDFHEDELKRLVTSGINYAEAEKYAEQEVARMQEDFNSVLDALLGSTIFEGLNSEDQSSECRYGDHTECGDSANCKCECHGRGR